jgi:leucyl/phenylalanyl-tRNA--protein transferase
MLCLGEDFEPATLLEAYGRGIFPWPAPELGVVIWCSPDPRMVLDLSAPPRWTRSVRRDLRRPFEVSVNRAFAEVVRGSADRAAGTWITGAYRAGFERLRALGSAHSLEVWSPEGDLAGGIYGVAVGATFTAESMFHRASGASKVAFARLAERLAAAGFETLDAQLPTPHLASLGCVPIPRADFLGRLARGRRKAVGSIA